ncbi:MAG: 30S ribosomal protein S12 methylthiotransferase RimO [Clostridiales bacterium]|nr:30S ribosomal protein S12 methylthiotransferase RimO [Clostridiales bacterium]
MSKSKIGFVSLGCPKNQIDTEIMLKELHEAGYELTAEETEADIVIINTCAFIESAKKEAIDNILDIAILKKQYNLKGIIVTGCLAQRYQDEIMKEMPEVDAVVGCGGIHSITEAVKAVEQKQKYTCYAPIEEMPLGGSRIITTPSHYAYLKIAEGCDNHCTYCAIPMIRGKFRSRGQEEIVAEAMELEALGAKEIILVAQDVTRYGEDISESVTLCSLIHAITDSTKTAKIRLLYCYPDKITDELVEEMRTNDRVLHYIDLPVQHIADGVLKRMGRRGGRAAIETAIKKLRDAMPDIVIRTTLITGFPGESEEDFEELRNFAAEVGFERLGVFPYSREEGTAAALLPDQIDEQVKLDRAEAIMKDQFMVVDRFNQAQVGKTFAVLVDDFDVVAEAYYGRSYMDAPDIDPKIYFVGKPGIKPGQIVHVMIDEVIDYDLTGHVVEP